MSSPKSRTTTGSAWRLADPRARRIRQVFWAAAIVLGLVQAWMTRGAMENDGVSFAQIGQAVLDGNWREAITGYYQPLWGLFLAVPLALFRPATSGWFFTLHLVTLGTLLAGLATFDYFLRSLIFWQRNVRPDRHELMQISDTGWMLLGYSVCLWALLDLVGVAEVNPDIANAVLVFAILGLVVRIRATDAAIGSWVALGALLAVGYYVKSIFFVLAPVFFVAAAVGSSLDRRRLAKLAAGVAVFLVAVAPFILELSLERKRFTYGDTGRLNVAWQVGGIPARFWQAREPGDNRLPLRPHELVAAPPTYEFAGPPNETYPMWYDISRYYEGMEVSVRPQEEARRLASNVLNVTKLLFGLHGALAASVLIVFGISISCFGASRLPRWLDLWYVLLPCALGLAMYAAVHLEPRYCAQFIAPAILGIFASVPLPAEAPYRRVMQAMGAAMAVLLLIPGGPLGQPRGYTAIADLLRGRAVAPVNEYSEVADDLGAFGLHPGDRVATLEHGNLPHVLWAWLGRFRIVAEVYFWMPEPQKSADYWSYDSKGRQTVLRALASTGARAVVTARAPQDGNGGDWIPLRGTSFYALNLEPYRRAPVPVAAAALPVGKS